MRNFKLVRDDDIGGNTGTGVVAYGVEFPWGAVSYCFVPTPEFPQPVFHNAPDIDTVERLHSHEGRTRLVWLDKTVWTLGYLDELTTADCGEPLLAVIDVFASRQAAIDYVRNSADLTVDNEEQTSPVEYRMSGDALGSGRFLIVLREEVVKS